MTFFRTKISRFNYTVYLPYFFLLLICILNISWNITDHDDGHTLGFHNMGRNPDIQRPYGMYDSMCDFLLGFLPKNYKVLFGFMIGATILSSFLILYLMGELIKNWFKFTSNEVGVAQVLFLFSMPEFLYMSFSFKSIYISLSFILFSGYILFNKINSFRHLIFSSIVFGFGVSLRWNLILIGAPFAVMFLWELIQKFSLKKSCFLTFIWGISSIITSISFIFISGYSPIFIIKTYLWGREYLEKVDFQLIARVGDLSLFLTPTTIFLFILAIVYLKNFNNYRKKFISLLVTTFLSISLISLAPGFKLWAPLWVCFLVLFGFSYKFYKSTTYSVRKLFFVLLVILISVNWFLGIQIDTSSSNWGPGLDVKTNITAIKIFDKSLNTDDRFKFENIKIGFFDGFCLPTSEGMRPLYGHFYALFAGKLHQIDEKLNRETDIVLNEAKAYKQIIYQDRVNPYLLASYTRFGFSTLDNWKQNNKEFHKRTFSNGKDTITEIRVNNPQNLFDISNFKTIIHSTDTIYAAFTYTSSLNKFLHNWQSKHNGHYEKMGPLSAKLWQ